MLRIFAALVALISPLPAFAQCNVAGIESQIAPEQLVELDARATATPFGHGLYWSATKDGAELAIIGTMHLPDPRHTALVERVMPELQKAGVVLVEATLEDQLAMQAYMAENPDVIGITTGPTLPEQLDAATWDAIRDAAYSRGVPGFMAAKMQPWFLSMTLAIPPCAMASMVAGETGLDGLLMEQAAALDIPVMALEPWQDMFALLSAGTFEEQVDALRMSLIAPGIQDAFMVTLVSAYFDENSAYGWLVSAHMIDFLPDMDRDLFFAQMAELEEQLLYARNRNWIPVINDAAQTHDHVFVAFGAAHLIGDQGVLALLEADGWSVTRR